MGISKQWIGAAFWALEERGKNPAVAIARAKQSRVVICETGVGRSYYKGLGLTSGLAIEVDDPVRTRNGFVVINEGVQYSVSPAPCRRVRHQRREEAMTTTFADPGDDDDAAGAWPATSASWPRSTSSAKKRLS